VASLGCRSPTEEHRSLVETAETVAAASFGAVSVIGFEAATERPSAPPITLDDSQAAVVALADGVSAAVIGAPGTGKTTTIVELVADRVLGRGWSPEHLVVLTPSRVTATRLRDILSVRIGTPTDGPLARTVNSLAFEVVSRRARAAGGDLRLISGGEQDLELSQLLAGHEADDSGPAWPDPLGPDVRRLRAFRTELRELMARATEYGVTPQRLRELAASAGHPEWAAAAGLIDEYRAYVAVAREFSLDSAELVQFAATALTENGDDRIDALRLVVVDDMQEATESTLVLLRALAARGVAIIAFGDPDVAANAFRGGEPDALGRLASELGDENVRTLILSTAHRQAVALRDLTTRVTARIGTAAAGAQRAAAAGLRAAPGGVPPVVTVEEPSSGRVSTSVARLLREHHLQRGIPWSRMAVVVRSGSLAAPTARALALAEVPTRTAVGGRPLRDATAARALLELVDTGIGRSALTPERAAELLLGPYGGLDRLGLRRLRLALRAEELAGGGSRTSDELLVEALQAPGRLVTIDHRVARAAERLAATLAAIGAAEQSGAENGGATVEELLWLAWERSGMAKPWGEQALGSGILADEANRHLDGVVGLFTAARRWVERDPADAVRTFLENVLDAEVPEDTLSPQPTTDTVFVSTPPGVVGLEFDVVVVAGVHDGVWPNLRLRGSLLNAQQLVRVVTGLDTASINERQLVLSDELRMFALAVSRATTQVIVTAVVNDDEARSVFFGLLPPTTDAAISTRAPLSLRGITGRLRRELVAPGRSARERATAASALARLAAEQVAGADPADWHGLLEPSTEVPLFDDDETVPVSPSQLGAVENSPLDWFIDSISGSQSSTPMAIGTIVHWAMETATDSRVDTVWAAIESRWPELEFEAPWMAEYQRRATRLLAEGVAEYLADFDSAGKELIGAERRFSLDVDRARVNGSIDRVERAADGSVVIVDLKTGRPTTKQTEIDEHPQLGAYQLAYAEGVLDPFLAEHGVHSSGGAKLLFVIEGVRGKKYREAVQAPLTAEGFEGFRERIRQAASLMAAAEFLGAAEVDTRAPGAASRLLHRVRAVSSD
jgi:superfamily I DNA/RNA helicase/RecB family exonuclease